jgi:hypothetical protein
MCIAEGPGIGEISNPPSPGDEVNELPRMPRSLIAHCDGTASLGFPQMLFRHLFPGKESGGIQDKRKFGRHMNERRE